MGSQAVAGAQHLVIDARPMLRPWQAETADALKRFNVLVVHRRAGKTVFSILWLLSKCLDRPDMVGAYICPKRDQAKRIAWELMKKNAPPGTDFNSSELKATLPNGTRIYMLGTDADNGDAIRGLGIVAAVLDETADITPYAWRYVIRPALADHKGECIFIGTPKGRVGLFWEMHNTRAPGWHHATFRYQDTEAIDPEEIEALKAELSPDEFAQEFECSFDAAIKGAYYGKYMSDAEREGRITSVPHDPGLPVYLSFDLGFSDATSVWAWQFTAGGQIHAIYWREWQNTSLPAILNELDAEPWMIAQLIMPHDAKVHDLGSGRTRRGVAEELGYDVVVAPNVRVRDGIEAVRTLLPRVLFDTSCGDGIEYLKQYRADYDDKNSTFRLNPVHDFTSHAADSVRYMAVSQHLLHNPNLSQPIQYNVSGAV